jgi:nicotinate-nucleotide--dimethylbenzimidazole phosphoribosyltransferase
MSKLQEVLNRIQPVDTARTNAVQAQLDNLTKPQGSLGRLEELARKYCLITGKDKPQIRNKIIFTFAGDHGVTEEGVSAYPREVTPQMVLNFIRGGAAVNVLAKHVGARVIVVDMGVDHDFEPMDGLEIRKIGRGTRNMTKGPAMTRDEAERAVLAGIELVEKYNEDLDLLGTGDMGIGNTTPSSAIVSVITGADAGSVTGRGTGIDDNSLRNKIAIIKKAIAVNDPDPKDALDVLIAAELNPLVKGYMIAAHQSVEIGHRKMLEHLEQVPLLDLNLRLGEGTGAALGMSLVEAGVKILGEMATFADAGVAEKAEGEKVGS